MIALPKNYYHCYLGNGLDAVLVGYTGSMVSDRVSIDRCAWYKSDRYYPEDKLVMVAGRWPLDKKLEHAEGSGWFEAAPLGRTWYYVMQGDQRMELQSSDQRFVPQEGTLYSDVVYAGAAGVPGAAGEPVKGKVETWLHATRSILVERYTFEREVVFQAWMGAGVWPENNGMPWDTDPFYSVEMSEIQSRTPEASYDLGETKGIMALRVEPAPRVGGGNEDGRYVAVFAKTITKYFYISDDRQGDATTRSLDDAVALGYDALRAEHLAFWRDYFAVSSIDIPDAEFQYFYDASTYHFKAMQNRDDGGLPVNNLRRTWSSHVFWDSYFLHRALLESNHRAEALEGARFFQRTIDHARRHARDEFGCDGLKWDWEITHDGRKAYGALLHMKNQVHNNGSYSNIVWSYYQYTQDKAYLEEFFPILEGLAQFFMAGIIQQTEDGYEIGYLVGVHESPVKVRNDGTNLAGTIAILRHYVDAARILGRETAFTDQCAQVAAELLKPMDALYNGRFFKASDEQDKINMSSISPIYPMGVIPAGDPRAISTAQSYVNEYRERLVGFGTNSSGSAWSAGVLSSILAWQHNGDLIWKVLDGARLTMCSFGGMTEVMTDGEWNMQYFGTAQAACCIALHLMLMQTADDQIDLFPALPSAWERAGFDNLLAAGFGVSASYTSHGGVTWIARNLADVPLTRTVRWGIHAATITLQPGETSSAAWQE